MTGPTLDPDDWDAFRAAAHKMLEASLDKMQSASEGPVWRPLPDDLKQSLSLDLPTKGQGIARAQQAVQALLPYGVGNTHPRFFGWVHGAGSPGGMVAEIAAAAINANLGGRDHGAIYVEKQVVEWVRQMFGFPASSSGLIVSGTSIATMVALKTARDTRIGPNSRKAGLGDSNLVGYTSAQAHSCVARAFDMLGLGSDALRLVAVNAAFEMDVEALETAIAKDRAAGFEPFCVVGTAGSVNVGAIDDLEAIADMAARENLWFHIDGAFGASGVLSDHLRDRLIGITRADSIAFDFHKWLHVNYDAGFVLIRDEKRHRAAFTERPDYLKGAERGLAAGNPWPTEYGPELSRGFRALKIWLQFVEHGTEKLGAAITKNCLQAKQLERLVLAQPQLELLAPVATGIVCFRFTGNTDDLDQLNENIVIELQVQGIAAPSTTTVNGQTAIRVNITNHRTRDSDLELLITEILRIGTELSN